MKNQCYLMSLEEILVGTDGERLFKEALGKVDHARRMRAERMQPGKARAACLGAGLLLQLAVQEREKAYGAEAGRLQPAEAGAVECPEGPAEFSAAQVLQLLREPLELVLDYGKKGKPYLREYPYYFNLSHSGEYVICAMSDQEIGADIQQCVSVDVERLAGRFFSAEECKALTAYETESEKQQFFFRQWARKEAYGKLIGEGIAGSITVNLLPDAGGEAKELCWQEWDLSEGYKIALCQRVRCER